MARASTRDDKRPDAHASDAPGLDERIEDMEQRLGVQRALLVARGREFRGNVMRRLTSPTSLVFSASIGFIASEFLGARSRAAPAAQRAGRPKKQQKGVAKSLLAAVLTPILPMARMLAMGLFVQKSQDVAETIQHQVGAGNSVGETLH